MPAEKPFNKYYLPGRLKPLRERITQPLDQEERIARFAIPSWENMEGIIENNMHNNLNLYTLSLKHRGVLRQFYDARYAIATGEGRKLYETFLDKYGEKATLMTSLTPHFTLIRDKISPPHQKK